MQHTTIRSTVLVLALVSASAACGSTPSDEAGASSDITEAADHADFDVTWKPETIVVAAGDVEATLVKDASSVEEGVFVLRADRERRRDATA